MDMYLERHYTLLLIVTIAIIVAIRASYFSTLSTSIFFKSPILDSKLYDWWAMKIASGQWLGNDAYFMGPLYPYFLGIVYLVIGHNMLGAAAIQLLIGAASIMLVFLTAKKIAGNLVAVTSALILAFYGPLTFYDGLLLPEVLGIFLNLGWIYLLVRQGADFRLRWFFLAGILLGFSVLGRASALFFVIAIGIWLLWVARVRLTRALVYLGVLVLGILLIVVPVAARNYIVSGDMVLVTSNGGLNFYLGNNENATGLYDTRTAKELRPVGGDVESDWTGKYQAELHTGRQLKPSQVSDYWFSRGVAFVREHPARFLSLTLRKCLLFWNGFEVAQVEDYNLSKEMYPSPFLLISFAIVGPLALVGMILTARKSSEFGLLQLVVVFYMLSISLFFITGRYRIHVVPVLSIFSAFTLWWLAEQITLKSLTKVLLTLLMLLGTLILTGKPMLSGLGVVASKQAWHARLGLRLLDEPGQLDSAIRELQLAARIDPSNAALFDNLGLAYAKKNMLNEAVKAFEQAIAIDSTSVSALYNLALTKQRFGDYEGASQLYEKALRLQPYFPRAHFTLALCLERQGNLAQAAEHLQIALKLVPRDVEAHTMLGIVLSEKGDREGAIRELEAALDIDPDFALAETTLAKVLGARQRR
jgi:tetratricopeptide (TPR) repeat protein